METQSLPLQATHVRTALRPIRVKFRAADLTANIGRIALAGAAAIAVVFAAVWAAMSPAMAQYLSGVIWGAGFIFFALALEPGVQRISPYIATGIALPALALLGSRVAPEFSVLAGAVIAVWLAAWIAHRK